MMLDAEDMAESGEMSANAATVSSTILGILSLYLRVRKYVVDQHNSEVVRTHRLRAQCRQSALSETSLAVSMASESVERQRQGEV